MNPKQKLKKFMPFIALVVLITLSLACASSSSPTILSTSDQVQISATHASTPTGPEIFQVGNLISISDISLMVLGWEEIPATNFNKPEAGNKFVAVELLILNNTQLAFSVSPPIQMSLKDDSNQKYGVKLRATASKLNASVGGELAPGEKVRGKVGFEVAQNAQGLQFVFDPSIFGISKVFVDLGTQPISIAPPATLAGEIALNVFNVGDVIDLGNKTLTVNQVNYPSGNLINQPADGYEFLVVDLTITNKSTSAVTVSTLLQMSLKDSGDQKYDVDFKASAASGGSAPDGEIAPGETIRGQVGFQVPINATRLLFVFDADVWGTGKVFVALP